THGFFPRLRLFRQPKNFWARLIRRSRALSFAAFACFSRSWRMAQMSLPVRAASRLASSVISFSPRSGALVTLRSRYGSAVALESATFILRTCPWEASGRRDEYNLSHARREGGQAMPVHDWTRVEAGIFHAFHHDWITDLARALNQGILPEDYY